MLTSFFIVLLILVLVILYVTWPLFKEDQSREPVEIARPVSDSYEELLQQLRDLDFDHQSGKISSEDYPVMREALLVKTADVLEVRQAAKNVETKGKG
jgi:ABC-type Na+ efflux pump permease subunit